MWCEGDAEQVEVSRSAATPPPPCQLGHIPEVGQVEAHNNGEAEVAGEFLQWLMQHIVASLGGRR